MKVKGEGKCEAREGGREGRKGGGIITCSSLTTARKWPGVFSSSSWKWKMAACRHRKERLGAARRVRGAAPRGELSGLSSEKKE